MRLARKMAKSSPGEKRVKNVLPLVVNFTTFSPPKFLLKNLSKTAHFY